MSDASRHAGLRRVFPHQIGFCFAALWLSLYPPARADQSVSLAWDPSPDTNVVGYILYYGNATGVYSSRVDVGTNTAFSISGLKEGQTNFFVVTAYDVAGLESDPSNELGFVVPGLLCLAAGAGPGGPLLVSFPVAPGRRYLLQISKDLRNWFTIWQTNAVSNGWVLFSDTVVAGRRCCFYRTVAQ